MAFIEYGPGAGGYEDNILRVHGVAPGAQRAHLALYRELLHGESPLTRVQREILAVFVSRENGCHY